MTYLPAPPQARRRFVLGAAAIGAVTAGALGACTPTVRLEVAPIQIYAKLDADIRVKLDRELQDLLRENPNLF
ncbi:YnbE family lipoprotein [Brevundimonas sp. VNH65]|uniref:YnbE family lipoprotein n=1 Tax=Brevundimonas sp. VNH65 TaxID=3400917 RepID=UPI003C0C880C